MRILAYCSWFRPTLGRDCGEALLLGLERRGHELAAVVGHAGDAAWEATCRRRGWRYAPTLPEFAWPGKRWARILDADADARKRLEDWLGPLAETRPDVGFSFFATWIPPAMMRLPAGGFVNFHPAPLPMMRGYFPEDLAILRGMRSCGGTIHRVTETIDEGAILAFTRPAKLERWDTPDSLMQRIAEEALPDIWNAFDRLAEGKTRERQQDPAAAGDVGYEALYAYGAVDWARDDHLALHRKFQVFRGQDHRMLLKADWLRRRWVVWDWELHAGDYVGEPGEFLGNLAEPARGGPAPVVIRTTGGVCCVWECEPYVKEEGSPEFVDRRRMDPTRVMAPGRRYPNASTVQLRPWKCVPRKS